MIPIEPGAYLLHLRLPHPRLLQIGRLGEFSFPAGEYLYLGSACGPGGLRARLGRHLRGGGKPHWHIDALRAVAEVPGYGYLLRENKPLRSRDGWQEAERVGDLPLECAWAQSLAALPGFTIPVPGFGVSDCRHGCRAHLVAIPLSNETSYQIAQVTFHLSRITSRDSSSARLPEVKWGTIQLSGDGC